MPFSGVRPPLSGVSEEQESHLFHDNLDGLLQSAASGCHFCALIGSRPGSPVDPGNTFEDLKKDSGPLFMKIAARARTGEEGGESCL